MTASWGRTSLALLAAAVFALAQAAEDDIAFMPKGGRTLLLDLVSAAGGTAELKSITQARHSEAEWRNFVDTRMKTGTDRQRATLAAYLTVNMPLEPGTAASALPPDGRDLAWSGCQNCHSLFSGYLMQDRELQGWRNIFLSPFHRELKMSPQEREEFARYSALNMPLKIEDVPVDLRF